MTKKLILSIVTCFFITLTTAFSQYKADVYEWSWTDSTYHEVSIADVNICKSKTLDLNLSASFLSASSMRVCYDAIVKYAYSDESSMQKVYVSNTSDTPDVVYVSGSALEDPYLFVGYDPELGDYKFKIFLHDKINSSENLRR